MVTHSPTHAYEAFLIKWDKYIYLGIVP
jgi:hypothetical protein